MKWKRTAVRWAAFAGAAFLICASLLALLAHLGGPPADAKLVQNFAEHRAAFEQLRDMLLADQQLRRVAYWGVDTEPGGISLPPGGKVSVERFNQYLALLKQSNGMLGFRNSGPHPDVGICVWATGFAGDTHHISAVWVDQAPTNLVASLDDPWPAWAKNSDDGIYRHLDGNWYFWTDW